MDKVDRFEIIFEKETARFRDGDQVTGMVVIENKEEIKYKSIKIELCGTAIVFWSELDEKGRYRQDGDIDDVKGDCNKEQYFQKVVLMEKDSNLMEDDPVLEIGEHSFPFSCRLLPELPSSFEGKFGCVRYVARAVIACPGPKSNIQVKKPFTVISGLNLSFVPEAAAKIEICKYRELGLCCTEGSVTFDWVIDRSGFVSDEDIWIQGSIQNDSKHAVTSSVVSLFMIVEYKVNKRRKQERRKIAAIEKGATLADDVTVWNDSIHLPYLPVTGLGRCRLIDIKYELEFHAVIDGSSQPIVVTKEIYVGTVPLCLREMRSCAAGLTGNQRYIAASPSAEGFSNMLSSCRSPTSDMSRVSLTDLIAATVATTTAADPSAPLLSSFDPTLETIEPRLPPEDRPPPFAPGHEGDGSPFPKAVMSSCCQESLPPYNPSFEAIPVSSTDDKSGVP